MAARSIAQPAQLRPSRAKQLAPKKAIDHARVRLAPQSDGLPSWHDEDIILFQAQTFFRSAYSYFAYAILISNRLHRVHMARGAQGDGEEIPQPLWCRISLWISAVKRKHLGESSDGPSHYLHVPSEMEEALAGSFVYGLGLGMVAAALTVATSFLVIDADSMRASQSANGLPLDPVVRSAPRAPLSCLLLHRPYRVSPPRAHTAPTLMRSGCSPWSMHLSPSW